MKTRTTLVAEKAENLKAARRLAKAAEDAGRNFTPAERAQVEAHMAKARGAVAELAALDGDEQLLKSLNDLGGPTHAQQRAGATNAGAGTLGIGHAKAVDNYRSSGLKATGPLDLVGFGDALVDAAKSQRPGRTKALLDAGGVHVPTPVIDVDLRRMGERPTRILDLIVTSPETSSDRFRYFRQTVRTMNAGPVAPGALKPTTVLTIEDIDDRTRTYAHLSEPIPRQYLDDSAMLGTFVRAELEYGVAVAIEDDVIAGDGTGEHITGILNQSGSQAQAWDTDLLTTMRKAVTKLQAMHFEPTGWVLNPEDFERLDLIKDADGNFVLNAPGAIGGAPVDSAARRLWSVPVIMSTAVPAGTGILADWQDYVLVVREDVRVDVSENVDDDFARNLVRVRAEARAGLAALRPASTVEVDLTAA